MEVYMVAALPKAEEVAEVEKTKNNLPAAKSEMEVAQVKEGKPAEVVIEQSSGHKVLDEAALKAVKDWRFTAGRIGNMTVSSWIKIPVRFQLESNPA